MGPDSRTISIRTGSCGARVPHWSQPCIRPRCPGKSGVTRSSCQISYASSTAVEKRRPMITMPAKPASRASAATALATRQPSSRCSPAGVAARRWRRASPTGVPPTFWIRSTQWAETGGVSSR